MFTSQNPWRIKQEVLSLLKHLVGDVNVEVIFIFWRGVLRLYFDRLSLILDHCGGVFHWVKSLLLHFKPGFCISSILLLAVEEVCVVVE